MFTIIGGDGREYGPASAEQVKSWIASGRADLETKAKAAGTIEWKPLGDFPEFSGEAPPLVQAADAPEPALAGRGARLGAILIDFLFETLCLAPWLMTLGVDLLAKLGQGEWSDDTTLTHAGNLPLLVAGALVVFVVQTSLLTLRGQTVGKLVLRVRIVRYRDGSPAGFLRAVLLRSWLANAVYYIRYFGPLIFLVDVSFIFGPQRRCLHDLVADTKVVKVEPVTAPSP